MQTSFEHNEEIKGLCSNYKKNWKMTLSKNQSKLIYNVLFRILIQDAKNYR
jgi:hypothetical protein